MRAALLGLLLLPSFALAQAFPGFSRDIFNSSVNGNDVGNVIATSERYGTLVAATSNKTGDDLTLVHFNLNGKRDWTLKDRIPNENEKAIDVKAGRDGVFRVLSIVTASGSQGFRLYRVSPTGTVLSTTNLPNTAKYSSFFGQARLAVAPSGESYAYGFNNNQVHFIKFQQDGTFAFDITFPASAAECGSVAVAPDGGIVAILGQNHAGYITRKFSPNGILLWENTYFGNHGGVLGRGLLGFQPNGDVMVCGSPETSFGVSQSVVYRLDKDTGAQIWQKPWATTPQLDLEAVSLVVDGTGNSYITGFKLAGGVATSVVKYNSDGVQTAIRTTAGSSGRASGLSIGGGSLAFWQRSGTSGVVTLLNSSLQVVATRTASGETYNDAIVTKDRVFVTGTTNQDILTLIPRPR